MRMDAGLLPANDAAAFVYRRVVQMQELESENSRLRAMLQQALDDKVRSLNWQRDTSRCCSHL